LANRSGAGDLDVVVYSARKWARLALVGNPTVLLLLFVPDAEVVHRDERGAELVAHADRFVSRLAADRFLGYLPVAGSAGDLLRAVRRGEVPLDEVVARLQEAEAELERLRAASSVPDAPDRAWVDGWLHRSYTSFWAGG
jgi:hypothetical protein